MCNLASKQNLHSHPIWHSCCTQSFRDEVVIVNTFTKSLQDNKFIYHNHNTITLKILSISKNTTTAPTLVNSRWAKGDWWIFAIYFSKDDGIMQCLLWRQATMSILVTATAATAATANTVASFSSIGEVWGLCCWTRQRFCTHSSHLSLARQLANNWQQTLPRTVCTLQEDLTINQSIMYF